MIEFLKWDSEHFGLKIGNVVIEQQEVVNLTNIIKETKANNFDLLYLKGVQLPDECLNSKLLLADERVIYSQVINQNVEKQDNRIENVLHQELSADMLSLALQSGAHSRYYTDKNFSLDIFLELYKTWITDSLNGKLATEVLAYKEANKILGLLTYKLSENKVVIGLVCVDKYSRGTSIGTKLMNSLFGRLSKGTLVEVATQKSNKQACAYYERNGFKIESVTNIYHIWLNNDKEFNIKINDKTAMGGG